jgi:ABC-2 type transport system ATP-binding protein
MSAANDSVALEVTTLTKRYDATVALAGVTFQVPRGQVCGYLGPNGAGKSTTIKILAGVLRPDGGQARVGGHDVVESSLEAKRLIGYVPESGALYGLLTPREHLHLVADLHDLEPAVADERIGQAFEAFGLAELGNRRIDTLSKGQKQKTLLATALLHDPEVLLLDEPLNGLDVTAARQLKEIIRGLAERGRTILYCSHILDVVERVRDRAIILDEGEVVADASTAELVARSSDKTLESVFHSLVRSDDVQGLAGAFLERGSSGTAPTAPDTDTPEDD